MIRNKYILLILVFAMGLFYACTDTQDEHYDRSGALPTQNLLDLIAGNTELSAFSKLIEIAAYDTLLSSTQTFTVWAPDNNALSGIDVNTITKDEARQIVENHLARYNHSTSTDPLRIVRMKSNKAYYFSGGGIAFGGAAIQKHDILAKNGILHTLQSQIPYFPNIYEYILTSPNTSKMAEFIRQFEEYIIDPLSIGPDGTIRDTVYIRYNPLFDMVGYAEWYGTIYNAGLGMINTEDSVYTALIPDNVAWNAAYEQISPYFKAVSSDTSTQRFQTSLAIVGDLFFRGAIDDPAGKDSLTTTTPSVIREPETLFDGARKIQASNGLIFLAGNNVNYNAVETFMKPVYVEADRKEGRKITGNTTIVARDLDDGSGMATEGRFLEVYQTSLDDNVENQPRVTFDIPQVLSGKYNIYAEFLPGEFVQRGDQRATKFRATLNYRNTNGNIVPRPVLNLQTSATEKVKVLLFRDFTFPVADYLDRIWIIDYYKGLHTAEELVAATKLEIAVQVSAREYNSGQFGRSFCVDRIILEPVQN